MMWKVKYEEAEKAKLKSAVECRQQRQTKSPNMQSMPLHVRSCKTSYKTSKHKTKKACDYDNSGSGQTYDSSKADRAFNSGNIEVGTVGIYKPAEGAQGFTGHTITVTGVTRDGNENVTSINYIEGHMDGVEQTEYTFTSEGGGGPSSLYNRYSDTVFIGWGEFEPS